MKAQLLTEITFGKGVDCILSLIYYSIISDETRRLQDALLICLKLRRDGGLSTIVIFGVVEKLQEFRLCLSSLVFLFSTT